MGEGSNRTKVGVFPVINFPTSVNPVSFSVKGLDTNITIGVYKAYPTSVFPVVCGLFCPNVSGSVLLF